MVLLFRGGRGRGLPRPRAPVMMLRHMRPDFIPYHALPRGHFSNRPMRPGPMPLPRMLPPPLPPRPRPPLLRLPVRDMPYPPPIHPPPMRGLGIPPRVPMGPPIRGLIRHQPPIRGRGGFIKRGATVKRLVSTNGGAKKPKKRKEQTEEYEISKPWVTEALKKEIHKKYQLYEIAKNKKTDSDSWQAYKDQRIVVGKIKSAAKLEYIGLHPEADVVHIMFGAHTGSK